MPRKQTEDSAEPNAPAELGESLGEDSRPEAVVPAFQLGQSFLLLERYKDGDEQALNELLARYYPRILALARKGLRPRLRKLGGSMDVVQNTLVAAVPKLDQFEFRDRNALFNYLARILDNQLRDMAKAIDRRPAEDSLDAPTSDGASSAQVESTEATALEALSVQELKQALQECTTALPPEQCEILLMRELFHLTYAEIAQQVGCDSAHSAEVRVSRARRNRRQLLEKRFRY